MSFEFDPAAEDLPALPETDNIDRQESAKERSAARKPLVRIDYDLCEETGVCAQVCPENVFDAKDGHVHVIAAEACTECWICVENCISGAIDIG
jgi:MinD superfamily P-loop ATPase